MSVLLHYVYHQISDFEILYCTINNMIAKYIVLSDIISVVLDNILRICNEKPLLILKKFIVLVHTLSAHNSLLVRYKVHSSDPTECLCAQAESMVKPMKILALIQHHVERILRKNKFVSPYY